MDNLVKFHDRLYKIGVDVIFTINYPWVYINTINGKRVKEIFGCEHGFLVGFAPIRIGEHFKFTNLKETFKIIRRYASKVWLVNSSYVYIKVVFLYFLISVSSLYNSLYW